MLIKIIIASMRNPKSLILVLLLKMARKLLDARFKARLTVDFIIIYDNLFFGNKNASIKKTFSKLTGYLEQPNLIELDSIRILASLMQ